MKQLTALAICLFATGIIYAQNTAAPKKTAAQPKPATTTGSASPTAAVAGKNGKLKNNGPAIGGIIMDGHRHPIADVHAFIYGKDSSIIASGYTDEKGHYETNAVLPGIYQVKMVYPSAKEIRISGVVIKKGITPISITAFEPSADTTLPFTYFVPVTEQSKNSKK